MFFLIIRWYQRPTCNTSRNSWIPVLTAYLSSLSPLFFFLKFWLRRRAAEEKTGERKGNSCLFICVAKLSLQGQNSFHFLSVKPRLVQLSNWLPFHYAYILVSCNRKLLTITLCFCNANFRERNEESEGRRQGETVSSTLRIPNRKWACGAILTISSTPPRQLIPTRPPGNQIIGVSGYLVPITGLRPSKWGNPGAVLQWPISARTQEAWWRREILSLLFFYQLAFSLSICSDSFFVWGGLCLSCF